MRKLSEKKEIIFDPWLLGNSPWQPYLRPILDRIYKTVQVSTVFGTSLPSRESNVAVFQVTRATITINEYFTRTWEYLF